MNKKSHFRVAFFLFETKEKFIANLSQFTSFIFFAKILIKLTTKALGRNFGPFFISFAEAR
jgi:hypothetical protein